MIDQAQSRIDYDENGSDCCGRAAASSRTTNLLNDGVTGDGLLAMLRSISAGQISVKTFVLFRHSFQGGRIHIEKVNGPFLFEVKGTPAQYLAGIKHAIECGWIVLHKSGTYKFTQAGAALFA
jgi:hypothetical protein